MECHSGRRRIVFGVTAHGLGHLTRTCQLANALFELDPHTEFEFWTEFPRDRVASDLDMSFRHRSATYEPGTVHLNCFELDVAQTRSAYLLTLGQRESRLREEGEALRAARCDAVICDVPALLVRAAASLDIPAIAVSNFTWDWILEPILKGTPAERVLDLMREDYALGTHHIRLPFGPDTSPFASSEPGPLIARRATLAPGDVRARLGMAVDRSRPIALVCPGGWDPDGWRRIEPDTVGFDLVLVGDLPVVRRPGDRDLPHALPAPIRFPDLVNAVDVVLAKPGYGIASECVSHRTPLVTIDRPGFRETDLLRSEVAAMGPSAELGLQDFFDGRWSATLEQALAAETPWLELGERPDLEVARQVRAALGWDSEAAEP